MCFTCKSKVANHKYKDIFFCDNCWEALKKGLKNKENLQKLKAAQETQKKEMENAFEKWCLTNPQFDEDEL